MKKLALATAFVAATATAALAWSSEGWWEACFYYGHCGF